MSEEKQQIQQKENHQQQQHKENQPEEEETKNKVDPDPGGSTSISGRAVTPRAGALLVEVYGRVVGKQKQNNFSSNTILFDFIKYLVSLSIISTSSWSSDFVLVVKKNSFTVGSVRIF